MHEDNLSRADLSRDELGLETLAIRAGHLRGSEQEHGEPIYTTSSFVYGSAAEAAAKFGGDEAGNIYSRFTNPTVRFFEERLAAMEGGERCVATSSGMAAIMSTVLALLESGDEIVASRSIFGSSVSLFTKYFGKLGITTRFVELGDLDAWREAITPATKLLFAETPSNPLSEIGDIAALAEIAHEHNAWLAIDNCFCTPALQRPLTLGADIVIHSATKYLDGQGRTLGGAVVGSHALMEEVFGVVRTCGPCLSLSMLGYSSRGWRRSTSACRRTARGHWIWRVGLKCIRAWSVCITRGLKVIRSMPWPNSSKRPSVLCWAW